MVFLDASVGARYSMLTWIPSQIYYPGVLRTFA